MDSAHKIKGLFRVLRWDDKGSLHLARELKKRNVAANFNANEKQLDKNSILVLEISKMGFEMGGSYDEAPFWDEPYDSQYTKISRLKDKLEEVTGQPMRSFSSKYSAYDENTLKICEKLGVAYVFARGTAGARAIVYKPMEYDISIISTSDVQLHGQGGGTLADGSIWSRSGTPDDLKEILHDLEESRITLVAQAQLSGTKLHWWNVYRDFLDSGRVVWQSMDEFAVDSVELAFGRIPINRDVQYLESKPRIPLELEVDLPF